MAFSELSRTRLLREEEKERLAFVDYLLIFLLIFMIANIVVQSYFIAPVKVEGNSMNVTLQNGDWLYMSKTMEPEVGDVVVFARSKDVNYIKRIIALEGDSVRSVKGVLQIKKKGEDSWVNFDDEHAYYFRKPYGTYMGYNLKDIPEIKVGKGQMFVLGDNRWDSQDSRTIGLIDTDTILGIVPEWSIKHRDKYDGYLNFVEKINEWFTKLKKDK